MLRLKNKVRSILRAIKVHYSYYDVGHLLKVSGNYLMSRKQVQLYTLKTGQRQMVGAAQRQSQASHGIYFPSETKH